jgi:hypothetical protein
MPLVRKKIPLQSLKRTVPENRNLNLAIRMKIIV